MFLKGLKRPVEALTVKLVRGYKDYPVLDWSRRAVTDDNGESVPDWVLAPLVPLRTLHKLRTKGDVPDVSYLYITDKVKETIERDARGLREKKWSTCDKIDEVYNLVIEGDGLPLKKDYPPTTSPAPPFTKMCITGFRHLEPNNTPALVDSLRKIPIAVTLPFCKQVKTYRGKPLNAAGEVYGNVPAIAGTIMGLGYKDDEQYFKVEIHSPKQHNLKNRLKIYSNANLFLSAVQPFCDDAGEVNKLRKGTKGKKSAESVSSFGEEETKVCKGRKCKKSVESITSFETQQQQEKKKRGKK